MKKYLLVLVPLGLLLALGLWMRNAFPGSEVYFRWASLDEKYGQNWNAEREKLGLPLIEPGWYTRDLPVQRSRWGAVDNERPSSQRWSDFRIQAGPRHQEKELRLEFGSLIKETDRFCYAPSDSLIWLLELDFDHRQLKRGGEPWSAYLVCTQGSGQGQSIENSPIRLQQADSILRAWKLPVIQWEVF